MCRIHCALFLLCNHIPIHCLWGHQQRTKCNALLTDGMCSHLLSLLKWAATNWSRYASAVVYAGAVHSAAVLNGLWEAPAVRGTFQYWLKWPLTITLKTHPIHHPSHICPWLITTPQNFIPSSSFHLPHSFHQVPLIHSQTPLVSEMCYVVRWVCPCVCVRPTGYLSLHWEIRAGARCLELIKKEHHAFQLTFSFLGAHTYPVNSLTADNTTPQLQDSCLTSHVAWGLLRAALCCSKCCLTEVSSSLTLHSYASEGIE